MLPNIDLHIHTIYSDGTWTPREVVSRAKKLNLAAISITDHDSVAGLEEAIARGKKLGIEVVPGIEMSTDVGEDEIHVLGYYLNWKEKEFLAQLKKFQGARAERNRKLIKKLKELEMEINHGELKGLSGRGVISRLHIARLMVRKEYVSSIGNAFERWLNPGKPAYVKKMNVSPFQIIELILKTGGVPVFAHPFLSKRDDLIPHLVKAGLKGIEVYHSAHDSRVTQYYQKVAQKYHLLITGGSDCHGEAKDRVLMGKVKVPVSVLRVLKKEIRKES
ncbi:PHP domain-containing protein [Candidatus Aerophobetes bacterium]|uniref:PHP domain-containing protein n=1 Tax=Aerophobetes bacterium TaxID=2030807 RepID=A0A523RU44_UNCAE|nr:MAG: PHP domain-containing protein [Candidatus Aerophobetes bacterium]